MNENYIVVCDPDMGTPQVSREPAQLFREGDVLSAAMARQWEPEGVLLLPVHAPHLPQRGGTGSLASTAYQRHVYGSEGVLFDGAIFTRGCPAPVCIPSGTARVEWMARISVASEAEVVGSHLRLATEETSHGTLMFLDAQRGPRPSFDLLRGSAIVQGTERCFGAVCLAGACVGVRVLWFALTVLPR